MKFGIKRGLAADVVMTLFCLSATYVRAMECDGWQQAMNAIKNDSYAELEQVFATHQVDVNQIGEDGTTLLHEAISQSQLDTMEIVLLLVRKGADLELRPERYERRTPYTYAKERIPNDAVTMLLEPTDQQPEDERVSPQTSGQGSAGQEQLDHGAMRLSFTNLFLTAGAVTGVVGLVVLIYKRYQAYKAKKEKKAHAARSGRIGSQQPA